MRAAVSLLMIVFAVGGLASPTVYLSADYPSTARFSVPLAQGWLAAGEAPPGAVGLADFDGDGWYYLCYGEPPVEGEVLWRAGDKTLLVAEGPLNGHPGGELALLHPSPIETRPPGPAQSEPPQPFGGGVVEPALLARISEDSYRDALEELTQIPTRFSYTAGCDEAAELLCTALAEFGYQPGFHEYDLSGAGTVCLWDLSVPSSDHAFACGLTVVETEDGGSTWRMCPQTAGRYIRSVFFLDDDHGWAGAYDEVLITVDGGDTWEIRTTGWSGTARGLAFVDEQRGWACGNGFLSTTTDGGWSWSAVELDREIVLDGLDAEGAFIAAAGDAGLVALSSDGGASWAVVDTGAGEDLLDVDVLPGGDICAVGARGSVVFSDDGGATWSAGALDFSLFVYEVEFADALTGWAVGDNRHLFLTEDGGASWSAIQSADSDRFLALEVLNADELWLCGGEPPFAYYSADGGATLDGGEVETEEALEWRNVICDLHVDAAGTDEPALLLTAHYDSISEDPFNNAPGADDNGSGVVACLEAARVLAGERFRTPVRLALFSGEEQGLIGSSYYVAELVQEGSVGGVLNLDMYGYRDDEALDLRAVTRDDSLWLSEAYARGIDYTPAELVEYNDPGYYRSDHASFWRAGVPAIQIGENAGTEWNPYYHTTEDTIDKLDLGQCVAGARAAAATVLDLVPRVGAGSVLENVYAYPAPFRPAVGHQRLTFCNLPAGAELTVYDLTGARVYRADGLEGTHRWGAVNDAGRALASGVYLYVVSAGGESRSGKLTVIR